MKTIIIFAAAVALLAGLLISEKKENLKGILLTKPFLSGLFIIMALIQPHGMSSYFYMILAGLALCFVGDICLAFFFNRKIFTLGLVFFLLGHVLYVIAFFTTAGTTTGTWISLPVMLIISSFIFTRLRPHLGPMTGPVIAYIAIISFMVIGAASLAGNGSFSQTARVVVLAGSVLFYCSDLFVARHRFVEKNIINRYLGLPMYYTAQFMLAFSVGLMG